MGRSRGEGPNKAARIAQSEEAQRERMQAEVDEREREEGAKWGAGAKKGGKKEEQAAKRAEQLRKKAENASMLKEEEESTPGRNQPRKTKQAQKKGRGLDLSQLGNDEDGGDADSDNNKLSTVNASGIDNAIDALGLDDDSPNNTKVERHPERRFGAALANYEEVRLEQMKTDGTGAGLRLNQRRALIKKEFEKHPDNPFNQLTADFDSTKEDIKRIKTENTARIESRLAEKNNKEDEN